MSFSSTPGSARRSTSATLVVNRLAIAPGSTGGLPPASAGAARAFLSADSATSPIQAAVPRPAHSFRNLFIAPVLAVFRLQVEEENEVPKDPNWGYDAFSGGLRLRSDPRTFWQPSGLQWSSAMRHVVRQYP